MTTPVIKPSEVKRDWYIVDASDVILGKLSTQVASMLRGKHKPTFTPHVDNGDFIVVVNAEKVRVTGKKEEDKVYYHHTQYPGGIKSTTVRQQREKHPDRIITHAVRGMLPKGPLGRKMLKKLKVYAGTEHPHDAQQPKTLVIASKAR